MSKTVSRRSMLLGLAAVPITALVVRPVAAFASPHDPGTFGAFVKEIKNGGIASGVPATDYSAKIYENGISVTHRGLTISRKSKQEISEAWHGSAEFPVGDPSTEDNGYLKQMFTGSYIEGDPGDMSHFARYPSADLAPASFEDVADSHELYEPIEVVTRIGFMDGFTETTFNPSRAVSRGDFLDVCYRAKGSPEFTPPSKSPFTDVLPTHGHYKAICWAHENGIMRGNADGTLKPNEALTRATAAVMLYRITPKSEYEFNPPSTQAFEDVPKSHSFNREIEFMRATGISQGWEHRASLTVRDYRPTKTMTRASAAAYIYRWHILFGDKTI